MSEDPAARVRTLLLRADNLLKMGSGSEERRERARVALLEAQALVREEALDPRLSELAQRRLDALGEEA